MTACLINLQYLMFLQCFMDTIPIGTAKTRKCIEAVMQAGIIAFYTDEARYKVSQSRYGNRERSVSWWITYYLIVAYSRSCSLKRSCCETSQLTLLILSMQTAATSWMSTFRAMLNWPIIYFHYQGRAAISRPAQVAQLRKSIASLLKKR